MVDEVEIAGRKFRLGPMSREMRALAHPFTLKIAALLKQHGADASLSEEVVQAQCEIIALFLAPSASDITASWLEEAALSGDMPTSVMLTVAKAFQRQAFDFAIQHGGGRS